MSPDAAAVRDLTAVLDAERREHRLRTHLTVARGMVEAVRGGRVDAGAADDALARVVDALMDAESLLDPRRPAAARDRPLATVVHDVVESFRLASASHLLADPVVEHLGDVAGPPSGSALRDVLAHLLDNALAHTPEGTTVSTGLRRSGTTVRLDVEDDAPWRGTPRVGNGLRTVEHLVASEGGTLTLRRSVRGGLAAKASWPVPPSS
jgi:signal transduction histidine kinase